MAQFIVVVSHQGPITPDFAAQPAPDPAMFGMPAEDDGTRTDPLLGQNIVTCTHYEPDFEALQAASTRIVMAAGVESAGQLAHRGGEAVAERLGTTPVELPERPRRLPRRRVRPGRRPRRLRREAARGPRRGLRKAAGGRLSGMTDTLRVILEVGTKRTGRGAAPWTGPASIAGGPPRTTRSSKLSSYLPRYAGVAERAGLGADFARPRDIEVVERVPGSSSTDFWGIAHVPSQIEREVLTGRRPGAAARPAARLLGVVRRRGRSRVRVTSRPAAAQRRAELATRSSSTCYVTEPDQFSRKVEVRTALDVVQTPTGLARHREAYLDAIRAYNADGRPARTWPIQFLIRRTAHHVMDHAWELEDRDLGS